MKNSSQVVGEITDQDIVSFLVFADELSELLKINSILRFEDIFIDRVER